MHAGHAQVIDPATGMSLDASANRTACYTCHPGSETRCLRGAMGNAVASDGSLAMQCQSCHGTMSAVGAADREGWLEEPVCQSCHTGTATTNNGLIRYTSVFDPSGAPRQAIDATFATDPDTPATGVSLYRFSTGHGDLQCSACHGSTHAIFPSSHANDNVQSLALQGHVGGLADCTACHSTPPNTVSGGPHGMHPIGGRWVEEHGDVAEDHPEQCRACHGTDYRGTVLSRALGDRVISADDFGVQNFWRGFQIGCYTCHDGPHDDDHSSNHAPAVADTSASTAQGEPVTIALSASDPDGDPLSLRIVSQPANGTTGLSGAVATYYPGQAFAGSDSFTFAAWDGSTQSNLGVATIAVAGGGCQLSCDAAVDGTAEVGVPALFDGQATTSGCSAQPAFLWSFGDGDTSSAQNAAHAYSAADVYQWSLTVTADDQTCSRSGTIVVTEPPACTITCRAEVKDRARVGEKVEFHGTSDSDDCPGSPTFAWDFGDGSPVASGNEVDHRYTEPGTYTWTLQVSQDGSTCETSATIRIKPVDHHLSTTAVQ
jgi:hypothetical protein